MTLQRQIYVYTRSTFRKQESMYPYMPNIVYLDFTCTHLYKTDFIFSLIENRPKINIVFTNTMYKKLRDR